MTNQEFQNKMNSIQEKIGTESANLILDEIGELLTDNSSMNSEIENKNKEIASLKKTNETLQKVNGNLLQQVAMGEEDDFSNKVADEPQKEEPFDFKTLFDEKRKFCKLILTFFVYYVYNYYVILKRKE